MAYKYITDNNLYEKQTYMYSEYNGISFIMEYLDSRWDFQNKLQVNTAQRAVSDNAKIEDNPTKKDLKRILCELRLEKCNEDLIDAVNRYTKSFEVRKRIYTGYDNQRKPLEGADFRDYESYLLLADCMISMYYNTKCLKYFNCLLKIDDTLLSIQNELDCLCEDYLSKVVKQELDIFYQLSDEKGINWEGGGMILEEFALLASDTARTKAYLQAMIFEEKYPKICIVYSDYILQMQEDAKSYRKNTGDEKYFDIDMPILYSLEKAEIPYILVDNKDINSERMKHVIQGLEQIYLIYSGYGGYILKSHLFRLNKKYIHVHAGLLPQYRGSTTIYYSYLQEKIFGATAIFLSEGIDEGEIIVQETFSVPEKQVDIDYIFEPYIRSKVLIKVIDQYLEKGKLIGRPQMKSEAETYFIIHPVLKHLAMLAIEKKQR